MPGPLIGLSETPVELRGSGAARHPARGRWPPGWAVAAVRRGRRSTAARDAGRRAEPPLAGLRVLDLGTIIAGPYTATLLGELGAEVIKIERPPHGDEFRIAHGGRGGVGFSVYNRDQRSLLLDLAADRGRALFARPGPLGRRGRGQLPGRRAGRLGIDHDQLAAVNPLITQRVDQRVRRHRAARAAARLRPDHPGDERHHARARAARIQADSPAFLTVPINDVLAAGPWARSGPAPRCTPGRGSAADSR